MTPLALFPVGLVLGLGHALETDHLVTVSTLAAQGRGLRAAIRVGLLWSLGHAATLVVVGLALALFKVSLPAWASLSAEGLVALVMIALGVGVLRDYRARRLHTHVHDHGGAPHTHFHTHDHAPSHLHEHAGSRRRPFAVGLLHGLAGSAALSLTAVGATSWPGAVAYLVALAVGSLLGMTAMTVVVGLPFLVRHRRIERVQTGIRLAAAVLSIVVGCVLGFRVGAGR